MNIRTLLGVVGASTLVAPAFAGVNASYTWVEVDNTIGNPGPKTDPINGAVWIQTAWRTFDLHIQGDFMLNGVNLGSAPGEDNLGLFVGDVDIFNTQGFLASNFESPAQGSFAAAQYDTYVTLGDNNLNGAAPDELIGIALNGLEPDGSGRLRGAWAHNPVNGGSAQDASNGIRLLRISYDGDADLPTGFGRGQIQLGLPDGVFTTFIGVSLPTPGAAALLGLGGVFAARRRR